MQNIIILMNIDESMEREQIGSPIFSFKCHPYHQLFGGVGEGVVGGVLFQNVIGRVW